MDKTVASLIGALSALAAPAPSHAATSAPLNMHETMKVSSYADLLRPIQNAVALLKEAASAEEAATPGGQAAIEEVQYYHHHHHRYYYRRYHHHHHHHHHHRDRY